MSDTVHRNWPPIDWLPISVGDVHGGALVRWAEFGDRRLLDPFFEQSAAQARWTSARYLTALADLAATAELDDTLPPDGFIFHLSRCGSTLVSQMLAAIPSVIAVSEAPPIDAVLRRGGPDLVPTLQAIVRALGRRRTPGARAYVVKLDSWHMPFLPVFRLAFPDTPWIFLFRDPVEVLVSHERQPGMQMVPGLHPGEMLGVDPAADDYRARVLAAIAEAALDGLDGGGGKLIDYATLPDAVFTTVLPHFGIVIDTEERATMLAATGRHAKAPDTSFTSDGTAKRAAASPMLRDMVKRHLAALHRRLLSRAAA